MALHEHSDDFVRQGVFTLPHGTKSGGGFVTVRFAGQEITVELTPTRAELIGILNDALRADQTDPPRAQGWRAPAQIIAALRYPVAEQSLRHSVTDINRLFKQTVADVDPELVVPPLIATKRGIGIRLNWLLEIKIPETSPPG